MCRQTGWMGPCRPPVFLQSSASLTASPQDSDHIWWALSGDASHSGVEGPEWLGRKQPANKCNSLGRKCRGQCLEEEDEASQDLKKGRCGVMVSDISNGSPCHHH